MDDARVSSWLVGAVVLVLIAWAAFMAWSSGVAQRWLRAWGLRGARALARPAAQAAQPAVQRQPHAGPGPGPARKGHKPPAAPPHRSGKRKSRSH